MQKSQISSLINLAFKSLQAVIADIIFPLQAFLLNLLDLFKVLRFSQPVLILQLLYSNNRFLHELSQIYFIALLIKLSVHVWRLKLHVLLIYRDDKEFSLLKLLVFYRILLLLNWVNLLSLEFWRQQYRFALLIPQFQLYIDYIDVKVLLAILAFFLKSLMH